MSAEQRSAWRLYDNSRLEDYRKCERMFYWRHVRDLRHELTGLELVFGQAWHSAMDTVWAACCRVRGTAPIITKLEDAPAIVQEAMKAFRTIWCEEHNLPDEDDQSTLNSKGRPPARSAIVARAMLHHYIIERLPFMANFDLLEVELPFAVPLSAEPTDDNLLYVGKIDKVVRNVEGQVFGIEHKSTGWYDAQRTFRALWEDGFNPNSQIEGYFHALRMLYGDSFHSITVDGALVHQGHVTKPEQFQTAFTLLPMRRIPVQLEAWRWETHRRINYLEADKEALAQCHDSEAVMKAFPKKTEACTLYFRKCPYMDLCRTVANPLRLPDDPPPAGYCKEHWSPIEPLHLGKLGISEEQ